MRIAVCVKIVPDDQDIQVLSDGSLDYSAAHQVISAYDLNAIEAAAQLAATNEGASVVAITAGGAQVDDSKAKKNILSRGVDELFMMAGDGSDERDAFASAAALAKLLDQVGAYDVVLCGAGSADTYAQQVDVQLAARLGVPVINGVTKIEVNAGVARVERMLEDTRETVEVPLPAVLSVLPDVAVPRIPGMKDILAAGKKPMNVISAEDGLDNTIEVVDCRAPKQAERLLKVFEASEDGALEKFAAAIKSAL